MNVLLLGSGGREHAFALRLSQSQRIGNLYIAPGNAGTMNCGENVQLNPLDFELVHQFCLEHDIDLLVPGNEDPLVHGIVDFIESKNNSYSKKIKVAGPNQFCAQLEGSKDFAKAFMIRHQIPTARYRTFNADNISESVDFMKSLQPPYVLKADGLAAGKGVIITADFDEAQQILSDMILGGMFGSASSSVVIEEFLHGIEISISSG